MTDHFPPSNWIPMVEADIDRLPTDSGEGHPLKSKKEAERLWAKRAEEGNGLKYELAYGELLLNNEL